MAASLFAGFFAPLALLFILTAGLRLAPAGARDRLLAGFGVDAVIGLFTLGPFALALALPAARQGGWLAQLIAPAGAMVVFTVLFCIVDEALRGERGGFRIRAYWTGRDGWARYLTGWLCFAATPVFWLIRAGQILLYPPLRWAWGLPRLRARDYIALSRHKTKGLAGADYLFCVYCEWMTGLWSLGTEMLRHLESMWCPLRFRGEGQCERCAATFADLEHWADPAEGLAGVQRFYELHYEGLPLGERAHLRARSADSPAATR